MKVFIAIFLPVWVDSFGTERTKSILMSVTLMGGVLGYFVGFQMTFGAKWQYCIFTQALCTLSCMAGIFLTHSDYLNIEKAIKIKKECAQQVYTDFDVPRESQRLFNFD